MENSEECDKEQSDKIPLIETLRERVSSPEFFNNLGVKVIKDPLDQAGKLLTEGQLKEIYKEGVS